MQITINFNKNTWVKVALMDISITGFRVKKQKSLNELRIGNIIDVRLDQLDNPDHKILKNPVEFKGIIRWFSVDDNKLSADVGIQFLTDSISDQSIFQKLINSISHDSD